MSSKQDWAAQSEDNEMKGAPSTPSGGQPSSGSPGGLGEVRPSTGLPGGSEARGEVPNNAHEQGHIN